MPMKERKKYNNTKEGKGYHRLFFFFVVKIIAKFVMKEI
jgi:hypothetical protein